MRFATKFVMWCAVVIAAGLLSSRPCAAQDKGHDDAKAAAGADHTPAEAAHGGGSPLAIDIDLAIWTGVVFLALFGILSKFAWPQISAALLERERNIDAQIAAAAAKHDEAKRLLAEHEARLAAAAGEVRALLEEARRDADHTRKRIESEGHQAAQDELARAIREIERAKDGAIEQLAKTSANVAVDLARKVVGERISPDEHALLVREALGKLAAAKPSKN